MISLNASYQLQSTVSAYELTVLLYSIPPEDVSGTSVPRNCTPRLNLGNFIVSIDRFLRLTFTYTPELFSKTFKDHLFYDFIVLRPSKSVNNSEFTH